MIVDHLYEGLDDNELVLEASHEPPYDERTIAKYANGRINIRGEYRRDGMWRTWQDMGASFPAAMLPALAALRGKDGD